MNRDLGDTLVKPIACLRVLVGMSHKHVGIGLNPCDTYAMLRRTLGELVSMIDVLNDKKGVKSFGTMMHLQLRLIVRH